MKLKPTIYYSHPIAGKVGVGGNLQDYPYENKNCEIAIENVKILREIFPQVNWYCPGEVEIPLQTARKLNLLDVPKVLSIDSHIIENLCCAVILHRWEDSNGVDREEKVAEQLEYPKIKLTKSIHIWECDLEKVQNLVDCVLKKYRN